MSRRDVPSRWSSPHEGKAEPTTWPNRIRAVEAFRERYQREPEVVVRAPGRVNLLGAHVDYSDGWVTPAAIDRAVYLAAGPGRPGRMDVHSLDFDESAAVGYGDLAPITADARWIDYPASVAWTLLEDGDTVPGIDAVYGGDVPIGAGVSSSAAVEVAFLLAWQALGSLRERGDIARAQICQRAENAFLGVRSGLMDPFGSLHGRADHLVLLDCRTLASEHLPLPPETHVVVANSGVRRRLVDSGYNDRPAECAEAVEILRRYLPEIRALRDVSRAEYELYSHHLPLHLRRRALHAVAECERVLAGARALRDGDLGAFHALVRRSHLSSRDLYEVSIPEIDVMAAAAWQVEGCYGARLAGGGFGGCVNALTAPAAARTVAAAMAEAFSGAFGREPEILICRVADGATVLRGRRSGFARVGSFD